MEFRQILIKFHNLLFIIGALRLCQPSRALMYFVTDPPKKNGFRTNWNCLKGIHVREMESIIEIPQKLGRSKVQKNQPAGHDLSSF